jgi:hypothetical protein
LLHESGGEGPEPRSWIDGSTAEQELILPFRQAAYDDFRILVVNRLAGLADEAGEDIA